MSAGEAFIAAYNSVSANRRAREQASADEEDRTFQKQQRARMVAKQNRDDAYEADLATAAKPEEVQSGEVYQPTVDDGGEPMLPNPTTGTFKAAGQRFTDRGAAEAAATAANDPAAVSKRVIATMQAHGKVGEAAAMRNSERQGKLVDMQISEAEQQQAVRDYDRGLVAAVQTGGHQALAQFITDSKGDGKGGALKGVVKPSADGKTVQYALVDADGKERVLPYTFPNDEAGAQQAAFMLSRGVSPAEKLNHVRALANDAADRADKDRNFALRKEEVGQRGELRAAQAALAEARAGHVGTGGGGGGGDPLSKLPPAVKLAYAGHQKTVERIDAAIIAAQAAGTWDPKAPSSQALRAQQAAAELQAQQLLAPYLPGAKGGAAADPLGIMGDKPPAAKPGAAPAPAAPAVERSARMPVPAPAAPAVQPAPAAPARGDQVLAGIERQKQARVATAQAAYDQASQQFAAVARSGDPKAIATYQAALNQALAALEAAKR